MLCDLAKKTEQGTNKAQLNPDSAWLNFELQHSTFLTTSSFNCIFFGSLSLKAGRSKGAWSLPCRIQLTHYMSFIVEYASLCPSRPPRVALARCTHVTVHPAAAWATSPSPRHRMRRVAVHLAVARATSPCLSQPPASPTSPCSSQPPTPPTSPRSRPRLRQQHPKYATTMTRPSPSLPYHTTTATRLPPRPPCHAATTAALPCSHRDAT
jgi:hypothetical protein